MSRWCTPWLNAFQCRTVPLDPKNELRGVPWSQPLATMTAVAGKQLCDFDPRIGGPPFTAAHARMCRGEREDPPQLLFPLFLAALHGRLSKTRGEAAGQPRPKAALLWRHGFVKPSCETLYRTSSALVPSSGSSRRELASAFLCQHRIQLSLSWSHCRTQCAADICKQPNLQTTCCLLRRGTAVIAHIICSDAALRSWSPATPHPSPLCLQRR